MGFSSLNRTDSPAMELWFVCTVIIQIQNVSYAYEFILHEFLL